MRYRLKNRKGLSPVIATIILSGVVLAVGGAVWSFSLGAAANVSEDYVNDTLDMVNEVIERFTVEHVSYNATTHTLNVWIYNYGDVKVKVDLYADSDTESSTMFDTSIETQTSVKVPIDFSGNPLESNDEVSITVYSRRQNFAYYTYYVP